MKKLTLLIALFALPVASFAQTSTYIAQHRTQSLLNDNVSSLVVSNATQGVTNLLSTTANGDLGYGTNLLGMQWTNRAGVAFTVTTSNAGTSTNDITGINPFKDVFIYPSKDATWVPSQLAGSGAMSNYLVAGTLSLRMVGRTGKSGNTTISIVPLYDDIGTNQPTAAGERLDWVVAVNGLTPVNAVTNIAAYRVAGAYALRVRAISSAETTTLSDLFITDLKWNQFTPY